MKHWLVSCVLAGAALTAMALPTVEAVQAEVQRGNYAQAESMMQEVVAAKPSSARAQYVLAEVMAHNKHLEAAERALQKAKELDPATKFTTPEKLKSFEQALEKARRGAASTALALPSTTTATATPSRSTTVDSSAAPHETGLPTWVWGLGGAAVALVLWRTLAARRTATPAGGMMASTAAAPGAGFGQAATYGGPGAAGYGMGAGNGYGAPPARGNGMLGTGLAVAGGLAAGMMAERLLHGDSSGSGAGHASANDSAGGNSGGLVPGMFDNDSAQGDLQNQAVDFGSGDGWGGGDAGGDAGGGDDGW